MAHVKAKCDFCDAPAVYDGKTIQGPWAYMCKEHFDAYGVPIKGLFNVLDTAVQATKTCSICGNKKPLTEYYQYTDSRGCIRYRNECKQCNLSRRRRRNNG